MISNILSQTIVNQGWYVLSLINKYGLLGGPSFQSSNIAMTVLSRLFVFGTKFTDTKVGKINVVLRTHILILSPPVQVFDVDPGSMLWASTHFCL